MDELLAAMAKHRDIEEMAARIYQQLGAWCDWQQWVGFAKFFNGEAKEEQEHAQEWQDYVTDRGGVITLGQQAAFVTPNASDTLLSKAQAALSAEGNVLTDINAICGIALRVGDWDTIRFCQKYTEAGTKQMRFLQTLASDLQRAGSDMCALQAIDRAICE